MQKSYGTSEDYHSHIARIERTPSVVPDFPHYPNVHKVFKNSYASEEGQEKPPKSNKSPKKAQKKVQLTDQRVEIIGSSTTDENCEVHEETIDNDADSFINRKRKGFELCKWKTFKLH